MNRRALLVGVNHYFNGVDPLDGCIKDAKKLAKLLKSSHIEAGAACMNFTCELLVSNSNSEEPRVSRTRLKKALKELFEDPHAETVLFYFSGHGFVNSLGGYLVTQDASNYEEGISFNELIKYANASKNKEILIILDCCQSGSFGNFTISENQISNIRDGVSILTASNDQQLSLDTRNGGLFTLELCNALEGGAADIFGNVTFTGAYRYIDRMFGAWDQRPTLKTNTQKSVTLRRIEPNIGPVLFLKLHQHFPTIDYEIQLDPAFEPVRKLGDERKERQFSELQTLANNGIVQPIDEEHMYYAAINSKKCRLTKLGQHYWRLSKNGISPYGGTPSQK